MYRCDRHNTGDLTLAEAEAHHFMHIVTGDVIIYPEELIDAPEDDEEGE